MAYGLEKFGLGGMYGPERMRALFAESYGLGSGAPSIAGMRRYGQGAMDLAGRANALGSAQAMRGLGGLNPYARVQAAGDVARAGAGAVGSAGVQGYLAGGSMMQNADLDRRHAAMGLQDSLLNRAFNISSMDYQMAQQRALQRRMERNQRMNALMGGVGSIAGTLFGNLGGLGSLAGGMLGGGMSAIASPRGAFLGSPEAAANWWDQIPVEPQAGPY